MGDSYKAFEDWINGMTDDMYIEWLEDKATEKQEEKALNIRTPLSDSEMEQIEREQEYSEETSNIKQVDSIVYDNRDQPVSSVNVTIEIPRDNSPFPLEIFQQPLYITPPFPLDTLYITCGTNI